MNSQHLDEAAAEERLRALLDALDDEPPTADEARAVVDALGVDIGSLAARVRAQIAASTTRPIGDHDRLRAAYERAHARGKRRDPEPVRPRAEQLGRIRDLLALAKGRSVAAHFQKLDQANDEELAELATTLRELLDEDDGD